MPDISESLAPKSDQLDNIDLRGEGHRVFTVTAVDYRPDAEQPVVVHLAEFPRPWKPGKNMRRVLAHCWGKDSDRWPGQRVELYADEKVRFGNDTPGGTRISRVSGISETQSAAQMLGQGKPGIWKVDPLPEETAEQKVARLRNEWQGANPERRKAIEAEVAALTGKSEPTAPTPEPELDDPTIDPTWGGEQA